MRRNYFKKSWAKSAAASAFEQNGLFSGMLREMGYDVTRIEGNVYSQSAGAYSIPMAHMTLIVKLDGQRYLADVGFRCVVH